MNFLRTLLTLCMLLAAGTAMGQAQQEWLGNYRDAYREMIRFEKYGKPKQLIQYHYQLYPRDKAAGLDGARLSLRGRSVDVDLPLDAAGRTVFPLLKAAYDENAALMVGGAGQVAGRARVSLATRPDGVYGVQELRAACEQALGFMRYRDEAGWRERKCVGVRLAYPRQGALPAVQVRSAGKAGKALAAQEGPAYWGDTDSAYRVVTVRFADLPADAEVVTQAAPAVLAPLFE